jgi:hypothetical protein
MRFPDKLATGKLLMNRTLVTTMMSRTTIAAAFAFALFALAPTAQATDVRIVNYVSYMYLDASAVLTAEGVTNADSVRSDALRLEFRLASHQAGMSGLRLATHPLPRLDAGATLANIDSGRCRSRCCRQNLVSVYAADRDVGSLRQRWLHRPRLAQLRRPNTSA